MEMPVAGTSVCKINRKDRLIYGEVISVTDDGYRPRFVVEWSPTLRVEYPQSRWRTTVFPVTCPVCDSEAHNSHA